MLRSEVKLADAVVAKFVRHDLSGGELFANLGVLPALYPVHVQFTASLEVSCPVVKEPAISAIPLTRQLQSLLIKTI